MERGPLNSKPEKHIKFKCSILQGIKTAEALVIDIEIETGREMTV